MPLYEKLETGDFLLPDEEDILREERLLIENLEGIGSYVKSDHILNLLEEIDGRLPSDKKRFLETIDRYFNLSEEQGSYTVLGGVPASTGALTTWGTSSPHFASGNPSGRWKKRNPAAWKRPSPCSSKTTSKTIEEGSRVKSSRVQE
jgi:hypothetical protein